MDRAEYQDFASQIVDRRGDPEYQEIRERGRRTTSEEIAERIEVIDRELTVRRRPPPNATVAEEIQSELDVRIEGRGVRCSFRWQTGV